MPIDLGNVDVTSDGGPPGFVTCDRIERVPTHQNLLKNFQKISGVVFGEGRGPCGESDPSNEREEGAARRTCNPYSLV